MPNKNNFPKEFKIKFKKFKKFFQKDNGNRMGGCISRQEEIINHPNLHNHKYNNSSSKGGPGGGGGNNLNSHNHNGPGQGQGPGLGPGQGPGPNSSFQKTFASNSASLSPIPSHHNPHLHKSQNGNNNNNSNLRSKPSNAQNLSHNQGSLAHTGTGSNAQSGSKMQQATPLGNTSAPWDSHNAIAAGPAANIQNLHNPARSIPSYHSNTTNNTTNNPGGGANSTSTAHANSTSAHNSHKPSSNSHLASNLANSNNRYTNHNRNSNTANQSQSNTRDTSNTQNSASSSKTPSQVSSTDRIFVALYDYAARTDADLSFRRGDKMEILDRSGGGWWMAKHMDPQAILNRGEIRDRGYVPSNFIAKYRSLESYEWYSGQIRRNEAERTLMNPMEFGV